MVRLAISVEGLTEERFVTRLIVPYLRRLKIDAIPIQFGKSGGDVRLPRIEKDLIHLLRSFEKVTTLYDFYGFKGKSDDDTKASLEQKILETVDEEKRFRVIPYVQMFEFEGLLFTSPEAIEGIIGEPGLQDWASEVLRECGDDPERINDSKVTAPSKRLIGKTSYKKTIHGPNIAADIGLDLLREKCSGFNEWMGKLESLKT